MDTILFTILPAPTYQLCCDSALTEIAKPQVAIREAGNQPESHSLSCPASLKPLGRGERSQFTAFSENRNWGPLLFGEMKGFGCAWLWLTRGLWYFPLGA